jgi:hypothetical protein
MKLNFMALLCMLLLAGSVCAAPQGPAALRSPVHAPAMINAPAVARTPAITHVPEASRSAPASSQEDPELQILRNTIENMKPRMARAEAYVRSLQQALAQTHFSCMTVSMSVNGAGVKQDCSPYRCQPSTGRCPKLPMCRSVDDCIPSWVCTPNSQCIPASQVQQQNE